MTLTEATARIVYLMMLRGGITSAEAEKETGYSRTGVLRILNAVARVIPLYYDEQDRNWKVITPDILRDFFPDSD